MGGTLLLPLLFVRGHTNFAGLFLQDRGAVGFRTPQAVRQKLKNYLSISRVPLDEQLEMTNNDVISNIADSREMSYMIAVACVNVGVERRKSLFSACGVRDSEYGSRSDPNLQPAVDRMVEFSG